MTDESAAAPDGESPKRKRVLRIGSQRPAQRDATKPTAEPSNAKTEPSEAEVAEPTAPQQDKADTVAVSSSTDPPKETPDTPATPATPASLNLSDDDDLEAEIARAMGEDVENLLQSQVRSGEEEIQLDQRYQATVLKVYRDSVLCELPGQQNGSVSLRQFEEAPEPETTVEVIVVGFSPDEQMYELTVPGASVEILDWSDIQEGVIVEAKITGHNKGGLECEVNRIRGFIPASQVALYRVEDFSTYVDQKLPCVVTEAKPDQHNLVLSHRAVLEREREQAREKLLSELEVGQIREGTVTRLQNFGAFVDLGGIDGLIHISQLSWDNIRHPSEVLKEGQTVKVRIDRIDETAGKIGLSYRELMQNPWDGADAKYPVGTVVTGTVSKIMDFGAFVKLEPGVEGLVHISELSHKRVGRVSQVVEEGQRVEVKIVSFDGESQRISLSMKAALGAPSDAEDSDQDATDEGVIKHVPKVPTKSLKGGVKRPSGGDQFGLNW